MGRGAFSGRALHGAHRAFAFSFVLITVLLGVLALCSQGAATAQRHAGKRRANGPMHTSPR